jgi:hypothetical protein
MLVVWFIDHFAEHPLKLLVMLHVCGWELWLIWIFLSSRSDVLEPIPVMVP